MNSKSPTRPVRVFKCFPAQSAIWLHPTEIDGKTVDIASIKISRSQKKKDSDEWEDTNFFRADDLPKVALVAKEAYKYLKLKSSEPNAQSEFID